MLVRELDWRTQLEALAEDESDQGPATGDQ